MLRMEMRRHEIEPRVLADLGDLAHHRRAVDGAHPRIDDSVALVPTMIPMFGTSTTLPSGIT